MSIYPNADSGPGSRREQAYRAGGRIARERIEQESPEDAEALRRLRTEDIVVVGGAYDHVELVLDALQMPFTRIGARELGRVRLRPEQLVVVNCPGQIGRGGVEQIRAFVERGGSLFTTDWALRHVVEPAFPGAVRYNERPTRDDVVRIELRDRANRFVRGVIDEAEDPQWWLEGSSYPITVLDPARVQVLIASTELEQRYGEAAVAVLIRAGEGEVFHMISHYYLQRTELRSARHAAPAAAYASSKGARLAADLDGLRWGDVESASSSARLLANIASRKKRGADPMTASPTEGSTR